MTPAIGILAARRLDVRYSELPFPWRKISVALAPAFLLSILLSISDYSLARSAKMASNHFEHDMPDYSGSLYFMGHWGFLQIFLLCCNM